MAGLAGIGVALIPGFTTGARLDLAHMALGFRTVPLFALAGLVTALTPCVYPLIPITVAIFGAGKARRSRGHAAALSATYVLGLAAMYSCLGLLSAATGHAFATYLGSPAVGITFAAVLVVMAASMFGAFDLALPPKLQNKLAGVAGFGFGSAFLMGLICGVVAAPCTGPALFATLTYVAKSGDLWLGFWLLFSYALGLGLPFFVLGTFSVALPKSGAWMEAVKSVLGILLVIVAVSFVQPFLPRPADVVFPAQWLAIFTGVAVFAAIAVGTLDWSFKASPREIAAKAAGVLVVVGALVFRFGWIVAPASAAPLPVATSTTAQAVPEKIVWLTSEPAALAQAKAQGKPVLIDFGATWCSACEELEHRTYADPGVRTFVTQHFVPLKVDATEETDEILALEKKYGVVGLPLVTVVGKDGRQLDDPKITGYLKAADFLKEMEKVRF